MPAFLDSRIAWMAGLWTIATALMMKEGLDRLTCSYPLCLTVTIGF